MSKALRPLFAAAALALLLGVPAQAEKRTFIIANNADDYAVDRCLATGARCGSAVANSYCRSREFMQALSYRRAEKDEVEGAMSAEDLACRSGGCEEFVAIECAR